MESLSDACRALGYHYYNQTSRKAVLKYCSENNLDIYEIIKKNNVAPDRFCLDCGKNINNKPKGQKFCNSSCAAKYNNKLRPPKTEEQKKKISDGVKRNLTSKYYIPINQFSKQDESKYKFKLISDWIKEGQIENPHNVTIKDKFVSYNRIKPKECVVCHNMFVPKLNKSGNINQAKTCSDECHQKLVSTLSKEKANERVKNGTHQGWKSRNVTSYPERFWIEVLNNNNIKFTREDHTNGRYFLDFLICENGHKIDLEIDGKQHKYKDRHESDIIRDKFLKEQGYIIYRVDWNSINKEKGKLLMKEKIDNFLSFYNSLTVL